MTFTYTLPKRFEACDYTVKAVYYSGVTKLDAVVILEIG